MGCINICWMISWLDFLSLILLHRPFSIYHILLSFLVWKISLLHRSNISQKTNFSFWCFSRRVFGKTIISHSKCQSWWFEWGRGANTFNIHIRMKIPSLTFHIIPYSSPNRRYHLQKHHPRHFKCVQGNALICLCLNRQCLDTFVPD